MQSFQVTQRPNWACPNMLIFVNEANQIIGQQSNPNNALTQEWAEDGKTWGDFDPSEYLTCTELK